MKHIFCRVLFAMMVMMTGCTTVADQTIDAYEANTRILAAVGIKNSECGVFQAVTFPVIFPSKETAIDLCTSAILATSCTVWSGSNPMPTACFGIPFNRRETRDNYGF
ncbi:MAG: hypothetical protein JNM27_10405 [Leptospirales bacterium]|nr:hypothetical protein [Leptospirales bacterium]